MCAWGSPLTFEELLDALTILSIDAYPAEGTGTTPPRHPTPCPPCGYRVHSVPMGGVWCMFPACGLTPRPLPVCFSCADMVVGFKMLVANNVLCFQDREGDDLDEAEFFMEALAARHAAVCTPCSSGGCRTSHLVPASQDPP